MHLFAEIIYKTQCPFVTSGLVSAYHTFFSLLHVTKSRCILDKKCYNSGNDEGKGSGQSVFRECVHGWKARGGRRKLRLPEFAEEPAQTLRETPPSRPRYRTAKQKARWYREETSPLHGRGLIFWRDFNETMGRFAHRGNCFVLLCRLRR